MRALILTAAPAVAWEHWGGDRGYECRSTIKTMAKAHRQDRLQ